VAAGTGRALLRARRFGSGWAVDVHALAEDMALAWPRWQAAGVRSAGERAWTAGRVAVGAAAARGEGRLGLPQECGLEGRVSYRKGCYLGQEIMARIEARGRLRRGLRGLWLAGPPPGLGSAGAWRVEDAAGRAVGALGSAAPAPDGDGWWALAVLRVDAADDDGAAWRVVVDGEPPRVGPSETPARPRTGW
jgi:tRNA-modifying protein YgfZ